MNDENSMSGESPELDILLARRVNPKVIRKLKVSLTEQELVHLNSVLYEATENPELYTELRENPRQVLKERFGDEFSDEAITGLEEIRDDIDDLLAEFKMTLL